MGQPSYTIDALRRGLDVLSLFSRNQPALSLTGIAAGAGLNKTTAFRVVHTLEEAGYLERDPATRLYRPGLPVLQLGFTAITGLEVRQVARPALRRLSQEVDQTVSLGVLDGMEIVYVDRVRNQQIVGVVLGIGSRIPAHCASMGKVLLAHLPPDELAQRLQTAELRPCTPYSTPDKTALLNQLDDIRRLGYALNDEELEIGLRAVAAPICNENGQAVAAVNVTGSVRTISQEQLVDELAPLVQETAAEISRRLGHHGE